MEWRPLVDLGDQDLWRGTILRFPASYPYEDVVDFMVIDVHDSLALLVATGYKAGSIHLSLPDESQGSRGRSISAAWLQRNWTKWVWERSDVTDVMVAPEYDPPSPRVAPRPEL